MSPTCSANPFCCTIRHVGVVSFTETKRWNWVSTYIGGHGSRWHISAIYQQCRRGAEFEQSKKAKKQAASERSWGDRRQCRNLWQWRPGNPNRRGRKEVASRLGRCGRKGKATRGLGRARQKGRGKSPERKNTDAQEGTRAKKRLQQGAGDGKKRSGSNMSVTKRQ